MSLLAELPLLVALLAAMAGAIYGALRIRRSSAAPLDERLREADARRAASEERFRRLSDLSSDWYWEQDEQLRFTRVVPSPGQRDWAHLDGAIGKTRWEMPWGGITTAEREAFDERCRQREPYRDFEFMRPDDRAEMRWVAVSGEPVFDPAGRFTGYRGTARDVHARKTAEAAYLLSEGRLAAATEGAGIGVFDYDVCGDVMYFSPSWKAQLGYAEAELASTLGVFERRLNPSDAARVMERFRGYCARPEGEYVSEFRMLHRDGSWRWLRAKARMFPDAQGRLARFVGVHVDITADREREVALAEGTERLRLALAAGGLVAWDWRPGNGRRVDWGEGRELILGPQPEGGGAPPDELSRVLKADRAHVLEWRRRLMTGSAASSCDFRVVWMNGEVRWIKVQAGVHRTPSGSLVRILGLAQDITERVAAGERLRDSESRYRAVLETTTDAVVMIDSRNVITYVNPSVRKLFGWLPEELVGGSLEVLQPERLRGPHRDGLARFIASGSRNLRWRAMESAALTRDGREVPIEMSFSSTRVAGDLCFVGFLRDISTRKRAEQELQMINASLEQHVEERTAQLRAANRELESFSYTVAHDLRAPLRAIDGFSRVLAEELGPGLDGEALRYLTRIQSNTVVMAQMIDELLELSRIGRAEIERHPVDLTALARQVAEQIGPTYPRTQVVVAPMPAVEADPTLMRMVLSNLIGNALKFSSGQDAPRVTVDAERAEREIVVRVADNGVGFDPQYASKLFGVFQRLHTREEFEGTGVGLATVARIVQRHGGRVWADSRPGEGATFQFSIPAAAPAAADKEAAA